MDVSQELNALRDALPGCDLAAFADLSSGMILCTSADMTPAQEDMDRLSRAASIVLDGDVARDAGTLTEGADPASVAFAVTSAEARVYLRAEDGSAEALALICQPETDLAHAVTVARDILRRIGGAEG